MAEKGRNERGGQLGGHEPPPELQDTPKQNRGYDEAVAGHSGRPGAMQVGTSGVTERRRKAEEEADESTEGRSEPTPGKAEGERTE